MKSRGKKKPGAWLEKLTSSNSHKRNLDTMKLLVGRGDFQEIIDGARRDDRLRLPEGGLSGVPEKTRKEWSKWYSEEIEAVLDSLELVRQEIAVKQKAKKEEISHKMGEKQLYLLYGKVPSNYLSNVADLVIHKFHLPLHFKGHVETYIVHGIITAPQHNYEGGMLDLEEVRRGRTNEKQLSITVYARLTPDELEELKHYIDFWGRRLPQYRPLQNLDSALGVEKDFAAIDKSDPDPDRVTVADLAERHFGGREKTNKVFDTVRNIKEQRQKRFEGRGKK